MRHHREYVKACKALGFNWMRFHTWVPPEEFMDAADQLGMMIQVEAAPGSSLDEWREILRHCRRHPSVVIFCEGNEEVLDESKIDKLRQLSELVKDEVPDAFFNPQEALRGVDYGDVSAMGEGLAMEPMPHNPRRLAALKEFADVFAPYTWGMLSYGSTRGEWRVIEERLKLYERPCLAHEICIHGSYINLDLERRYEGTRIGPALFAAARGNISRAGLLPNAARYFRASCAWMRMLRKDAVEKARKCRGIAGYDLLGPVDQHWHRTGYDCGIMNEFLEMKPGESPKDVLKYNGEAVLLLERGGGHSLRSGCEFSAKLLCSLFTPIDWRGCRVEWRLVIAEGAVARSGEWSVSALASGDVHELGGIDFTVPDLEKEVKADLRVMMSCADGVVENDWSFWIFPEPDAGPVDADSVIMERFSSVFPGMRPVGDGSARLVSKLDAAALSWIRDGGSAVLLGAGDMPCLPTCFQMTIAGRSIGNTANVVWEHPIMDRFPHDGYCDWQFQGMLDDGRAVLFEKASTPFAPIIEIVSSYKTIRKQAALFEGSLGGGRLVVCALRLQPDDPAAVFLLGLLARHATDARHCPRTRFPEELLCGAAGAPSIDLITDQAQDPNMAR